MTAWEVAEVALNSWATAFETGQEVRAGMDAPVGEGFERATEDTWEALEATAGANERAFRALVSAWDTTAEAWDAIAKVWNDKVGVAEVARAAASRANDAAEARNIATSNHVGWWSATSVFRSVKTETWEALIQASAENFDTALDMYDVAGEAANKVVTIKQEIKKTSGQSAWDIANNTVSYFAKASSLIADTYEVASWRDAADSWAVVDDAYTYTSATNSDALEARIAIVTAIKKTRDAFIATTGVNQGEVES